MDDWQTRKQWDTQACRTEIDGKPSRNLRQLTPHGKTLSVRDWPKKQLNGFSGTWPFRRHDDSCGVAGSIPRLAWKIHRNLSSTKIHGTVNHNSDTNAFYRANGHDRTAWKNLKTWKKCNKVDFLVAQEQLVRAATSVPQNGYTL